MARILVVDDHEYRAEVLGSLHPKALVVHARDYPDATYLLRGEPYDLAYLDYDFGWPRRGHPPTNGEDVAKYIAAMAPETRPREVIIHSNGVDGPRRMAEILRGAGVPTRVRPFYEVEREITEAL